MSTGNEHFDSIWDGAMRFSRITHLRDEIRQLNSRLIRCGNVCGCCDKWMKSSQCPKEKDVNGYSRGPHMDAPICSEFVEKEHSIKERESLKQQLAELQKELRNA